MRLRVIGLVFMCGFAGIQAASAQNAVTAEQEKESLRCLESTCRNEPLREKLSVIGTKNVRGVIGGFEQGAGINGGVQFTTKDALPDLSLRANFLVSTRFSRRADFEAFVPRVGSRRNHADAWFSYSRRTTTNYFGIGPRTPKEKSDFASEQRSYQVSFYRDLADHLQGGFYSQVADTTIGEGRNKTDPLIDVRFSPTSSPSASTWAPGLGSNTKILSYGSYLLYDRRDNTVGLTRGGQVYGRITSNDGLHDHAAVADYGWNEAEVDARAYIPIFGTATSLAVRSRVQAKKPKGGSQIPFYDLSWLGGREYVRGYETYRFRGNNVAMASVELRRTVHRTSDVRGVDVFGYTDSGQVWGDARSSIAPTDPLILQNQKIHSNNWHSSVGGGVQYRRSHSLAGRFEVGHGSEGTLFFASMSRGF